MPRANGVWLLTNAYPDADLVIGLFTVKSELGQWLGKQEDPFKFLVLRYQDGQPDDGSTRVDMHEFTTMPEFIRVRKGTAGVLPT